MTRLRRWVDEALWGPETGARLVVVHMGLSALIGLRVVLGSYRQLADTPAALFDPVPVLGFLDGMPPAAVVIGLQVAGGLAAIAAVARKQPRLAFAVAWLCYLVLAGLRGSRGKVLHNDLLLLWVAVPFLLAPVTARLSDRTPRREHGWPVRSAIAIAALIYFFAGYHKLRRSGLEWALGDNVRYVMAWGPTVGQAAWDGLATWVAERTWASRATGAFILAFELTFPVVLVRRALQPLYALVAVSLHVMTYVLLGLDYWAWALTVMLLLVDWPALAERWRGSARPARSAG
jgi:hypothetical protein